MARRILIRSIKKTKTEDNDKKIEWICQSLGFSSGKKKEDISIKIVKSILKHLSKEDSVATCKIAEYLNIKPSRVNHHVKALIDSGFLYRHKKKICLRGGSLNQAIIEMRKDAERIFDEIEMIGKEIDERSKTIINP